MLVVLFCQTPTRLDTSPVGAGGAEGAPGALGAEGAPGAVGVARACFSRGQHGARSPPRAPNAGTEDDAPSVCALADGRMRAHGHPAHVDRRSVLHLPRPLEREVGIARPHGQAGAQRLRDVPDTAGAFPAAHKAVRTLRSSGSVMSASGSFA